MYEKAERLKRPGETKNAVRGKCSVLCRSRDGTHLKTAEGRGAGGGEGVLESISSNARVIGMGQDKNGSSKNLPSLFVRKCPRRLFCFR